MNPYHALAILLMLALPITACIERNETGPPQDGPVAAAPAPDEKGHASDPPRTTPQPDVGVEAEENREPAIEADPDSSAALVRGGHAFAFDLFNRLAKEQEGNLFVSPSSIRTALAMTFAGARGDTEKQMAEALRFEQAPGQVHAHLARLVADLNDPGTDEDGNPFYELAVANALWGQAGFPFRADFIDLLSDRYAAGLNEVDFLDAPEQARQTINAWVEDETRERIKELIPEGIIDDETRLVLTNAIYFLGDWKHTFNEDATRPAPFHLSDENTTEVPMMHQTERLRYMEDDHLQMLELPYRGEELSMLVMLPTKRNHDPAEAIAALQDRLSPDALEAWTEALASQRVDVKLPRFSFTSELRLDDALQAMGMEDAFVFRRADFTGIASVEELFIEAVLHKAFVKVDEKGTEAAAATAVVIAQRAAPAEPVTFHADRSFMFLIRHNDSGEILFMGRVNEPVDE